MLKLFDWLGYIHETREELSAWANFSAKSADCQLINVYS